MQILSNEDYKLFKALASMGQESLRKTLASYLEKKYKDVICTKEYLIAKGDIPIALVAHMDTVFTKPPKEIFYDKECGVLWSPMGLGADDRAGVFTIIKILQSGLRPTVIFTTDEECGALGAEAMVKDIPEAPCKINYIIQLDRQGSSDCVFYDCDNTAFVDYVETFGFIEAYGTFSDIRVICPVWKIAGVNLSVGYYNEHSVSETLRVRALLKTIERVKQMLKVEEVPEFEYISLFPGWNPYQYDLEDLCKCLSCGEYDYSWSMIPVGNKKFCGDCGAEELEWCKNCGHPYEKNKKHKCMKGSFNGVQKHSRTV